MIVILTEKPSVARDLARVLKVTKRHEGYFEGNGYQITWAFGHLVTLEEPEAYDPALKKWNAASLPFVPQEYKLALTKSKGVSAQFRTIKKLFKMATSLICATDAGREGELIFRYIYQMAKINKPFQRLWISSLTDQAIRQGFASLRPGNEFDALGDAARCRSQADWVVGLNATRAYTLQYSNGRGVLSVGRVQTPVLAMIVRREQEIRHFKPEPFWDLISHYRETPFKYAKGRFEQREKAQEIFDKLVDHPLSIKAVKQKKQSSPPPLLFDLTELQRHMNKRARLTATHTLKIAQQLYEKKIITYPRTDSRYLTDDMHSSCSKTLTKLSAVKKEEIAPLNLQGLSRSKRIFNNAKVSDHHAIIPTGQTSNSLSFEEQKVLEAITIRFIAAFYPNCEKALTEVHAIIIDEDFIAKGTQIHSPGWLALYGGGKEEKEKPLPNFEEGESGPQKLEFKQGMTRPPNPYTEATLLTAMETAGRDIEDEELKEAMKEKGLGTPATRAAIIETLVKRDYIIKQQNTLRATDKGEMLIACVGRNTLSSAELTGEWESQLKAIEQGRKSADDFMSETVVFLRKMIAHVLDENQEGEQESFLGLCPLCRQQIIRGKSGYGCSAWKSGCSFRFQAEAFNTKINDKDARNLLARGRTSNPRKITDANGTEIKGYITINERGELGTLSMEQKEEAAAIGRCPTCQSPILEKHKSFSCIDEDCRFVIWKTIAGRKTSEALAKTLLGKGKSRVLKGFKSKAGKSFSAALILKDGKVEFDFSESAPSSSKKPRTSKARRKKT